jgi:imidazolonepropionase-like amidohydrolase
MSRSGKIFALAASLALVTPLATAPVIAETVVYRGATVQPVSGPALENADLVVTDGEIAAVGPAGSGPDDARVVDLSGKHVYPAFVHPFSALGLIEVSSVRATNDTTETGQNNANIHAEVAFHPDSELLPVAMSGGVLTAHVVPRGGVWTGTSAVMDLDGWTWEGMTVEAPVAMHLDYPTMVNSSGGFRRRSAKEQEEARKKALAALDESLTAARAYKKAREAAEAGLAPPPDLDPRLEALRPVLDGELPLWIHASEKTQIESALDWAEEEGFENLVLVTGPDVRYVVDRVAEKGIPVVLNGVLELPERRWEPYDTPFTTAAVLHQNGVIFAIGDGGSAFGAANARNLPFHAAMSAAFGLPKNVALRSVTLTPAELLGVDDRLGSLDPGKDATFLVTTGDPLEIRTRIERVFLRGREVDLSRDTQKRLYERYKNRPRPDDPGP